MKEIIQELENTNKWLGDDYKKSNYYREYLNTINKDLKKLTF